MRDLLSVIDRMADHRPEPFVAPLPEAERITVLTIQDGIPYRFKVRDPVRGWWRLRPNVERGTARRVDEAQPGDVLTYLAELPRFLAIALFRLEPQTWLCMPWNASDAAQRGWPDGEPRVLHLVHDAIRAFDPVQARSLAGLMLYGGMANLYQAMYDAQALQADLSCEPRHATYRQARRIVLQRNEQLRLQAAAEERQRRRLAVAQAAVERRQSIEEHIAWQLGFMGAQLVGWAEAGESLEVTWEYEGHEHTAEVRRDLVGLSAGICLAGTAGSHNLSSLVAAIQRARELHRYDLSEDAWV
jgi:hypothetical protein